MSLRNTANLRRKAPAKVEVPGGQIRVLESHHADDFEMAIDAWPFHKICWVAVGKGQLDYPDNTSPIQANDFLLLPAQWPHRFVDDAKEPLTLVVLCISTQFLNASNRKQLLTLWDSCLESDTIGKAYRARTAFHRSRLVDSFRQALREQGNKQPGWESALGVVATQIILAFAREHCLPSEEYIDSSMRAVEGAIEYIDTHVHESLHIEEMADKSHLSPRRFTELFKQKTGLTFSHYLNRKRIEYACQRLDETGHILYACHGSGFNDLAYFYRVFKKQTGMTPGDYLSR